MSLIYRINSLNVIHEVIDGEVVMINLDSGCYYTMNDSGCYLWQLIEQGFDHSQIVSIVAEEFSVSAEEVKHPISIFMNRLLEHGLIVLSDTPALTSPIMVHAKKMSYGPPELIVFEDMRDLLLLDPIHEISEQGWPHVASKN